MIAFDTNILIYAELPTGADPRHQRSAELLTRAGLSATILPLQVLGEFLHVCRRKAVLDPDLALRRIDAYSTVFEVAPTTLEDLVKAQGLSAVSNLQFFDALIIAVSIRAGATLLLSEDMHDGLEVDGLRVVNPFVAGNEAAIAGVLGA